MYNYYMPVNVVFGYNSLLQSENKLSHFGSKALIVTGRHSAKISGVLDELIPLLQRNSLNFTIFDEVFENPDFDIVAKGTKLCLEKHCDFIIGIGGGSPIDAAKAIAAMAGNNISAQELYLRDTIKKTLPVVAITTTSGTGTEVTQYSVLIDSSSHKKAGFASDFSFPVLSVLDPKYTLSLTYKVTRDTAVDALSHLLEGIYSNRTNQLVYPMIFEGFRLIFQHLLPCLRESGNLIHREKLMLASLYGGMVIAQTGTTLQHALGYPLTTRYGISHGLSNGLMMKEVMQLFYHYRKEQLDDLFRFSGITKNDFFNWLQSLEMSVGIHLTEDFIQEEANNVLNSGNMKNNPAVIDRDNIIKIYRKIEE